MIDYYKFHIGDRVILHNLIDIDRPPSKINPLFDHRIFGNVVGSIIDIDYDATVTYTVHWDNYNFNSYFEHNLRFHYIKSHFNSNILNDNLFTID